MQTMTRIGPKDHGRPVSLEEFESAQLVEGFHYELIDGKLIVAPCADAPHDSYWDWLNRVLGDYARAHPDAINRLSPSARVFVPNRLGVTIPQPDLAVYHDFPIHESFDPDFDWRRVSPVVVVEILSVGNVEKDTERNVELYLAVPSIREYWIVDPRSGPTDLTLTVYRRRGQRWQRPIVVGPGETYTTRLLPGFTLTVDPLA